MRESNGLVWERFTIDNVPVKNVHLISSHDVLVIKDQIEERSKIN